MVSCVSYELTVLILSVAAFTLDHNSENTIILQEPLSQVLVIR